jgi:hypothetical protein
MPSFSVLVHATADDAHLGRLLETLRSADEIVLVDHAHNAAVRKLARQYGARLVEAVPGVDRGAYAFNCTNDWILCVDPAESLSEEFEAALLEWKQAEPQNGSSYAVDIRQQNGKGWKHLPAETRLVNRSTMNWRDALPPHTEDATPLAGHLLRFDDAE